MIKRFRKTFGGGALSPEIGCHVVIPAFRTSDKRTAFTLAEVLITLGIVGVVAALTMPTLIQNYRNLVVETRL